MATEIVFVLDRSGSMSGLEGDVIGGFNSFVKEQQVLKDEARLTTVLFDDKYEILHERKNIKDVKPITKDEYYVRGSTALLDAIGKTIKTLKKQIARTDKVIFVINTDGYENASVEYTNEKIKELVEKMKNKRKWEFVFLGANIDSFATGRALGVTWTGNYTSSKEGVVSVYNTVSTMTSNYRGSGTLDADALKDLK